MFTIIESIANHWSISAFNSLENKKKVDFTNPEGIWIKTRFSYDFCIILGTHFWPCSPPPPPQWSFFLILMQTIKLTNSKSKFTESKHPLLRMIILFFRFARLYSGHFFLNLMQTPKNANNCKSNYKQTYQQLLQKIFLFSFVQ